MLFRNVGNGAGEVSDAKHRMSKIAADWKTDVEKAKPMTKTQFEKITNAYKYWALVAASTGMRTVSLCHIRREHIIDREDVGVTCLYLERTKSLPVNHPSLTFLLCSCTTTTRRLCPVHTEYKKCAAKPPITRGEFLKAIKKAGLSQHSFRRLCALILRYCLEKPHLLKNTRINLGATSNKTVARRIVFLFFWSAASEMFQSYSWDYELLESQFESLFLPASALRFVFETSEHLPLETLWPSHPLNDEQMHNFRSKIFQAIKGLTASFEEIRRLDITRPPANKHNTAFAIVDKARATNWPSLQDQHSNSTTVLPIMDTAAHAAANSSSKSVIFENTTQKHKAKALHHQQLQNKNQFIDKLNKFANVINPVLKKKQGGATAQPPTKTKKTNPAQEALDRRKQHGK